MGALIKVNIRGVVEEVGHAIKAAAGVGLAAHGEVYTRPFCQ